MSIVRRGKRHVKAPFTFGADCIPRVIGGIAMGAELFRIASREDAALDTTRILVLRQSLGDQRCREIVSEVVFHLTDRLGLLQSALAARNGADAQVLASRLASLSEQVGLSDFARVARDLAACLEAGDTVAVAAVGDRLMRLGEDSLFSVILYADQSAL